MMRKVVADIDDEIISYLNTLELSELRNLGHFKPKEFDHYIHMQIPWLKEETYFLGCNLDRQPNSNDLAKEVLNASHSIRFRAFYALKYPEKIEMLNDGLNSKVDESV